MLMSPPEIDSAILSQYVTAFTETNRGPLHQTKDRLAALQLLWQTFPCSQNYPGSFMSLKEAPPSVPPPVRRECFVTVGATASFQALLDFTLTAKFIETLSELEYTRLTIQCGPDLAYATSKVEDGRATGLNFGGLQLKMFDFNKLGLGAEMRGCKGLDKGSREGVVVCHAGAGTILDAMRLDVPIIVVPNPVLLDNHQAELAEELERQRYVIYGHLNDLPGALRASEKKSKARTAWESVNNAVGPTGRGVVGVMDEELGYESRMREILD